VALDTADADRARALVRGLDGRVGGFKIGLELFSSHGPALVREIRESFAGELFVDLKLHDIPNTAAAAAAAVARLGVTYFTLHASGGFEMMRRAVEAAGRAADEGGRERPIALGVTVLTSLDDEGLREIGMLGPCGPAVSRLAGLAARAGAGGFVCSPLEAEGLRRQIPGATLVVPGIRPGGVTADGDDQARHATPARAVALGADRLVIGRPITQAADPAAAAREIVLELERARA